MILALNFVANSQTVTIESITYNNNGQSNTVTNCGTIDFKTSPSLTLTINIKIDKPTNLTLGLSTLTIYTRKHAQDWRIYRSSIQILDADFLPGSNNTSTAYRGISTTINASDFDLSGGTLFATLKSSSNSEYNSCNFPIIKTATPTFYLHPSSLSIPCGSTDVKEFWVENQYNTQNVTYNWSYPGWTLFSAISNSNIYLKPNSPNSLPSNVSVTPVVNGVNQQTQTAIVNRSQFTTNGLAINGNNTICPGNNIYNLINLPNNTTVLWSITGNSNVNIVNQSNSQITLSTSSTDGLCTLNAQITNQCGQIITISKVIPIGFPNPVIETVRTSHCIFEYKAKDYQSATTSNFNYNWELINSTGYVDFYPNGNLATVSACPPFSAKLKLTTSNSCGSIVYETDLVLNSDEEEINKQINTSTPQKLIKNNIYPNPTKDILYLNFDKEVEVSLFEISGKRIKTLSLKKGENSLDVSQLDKGIYLLKVEVDNTLETHKIIIQ